MVPARILVVDDNVQILESLRILLKEEFEAIDVITNDVLDWSVYVRPKDVGSDDTLISYEYRCTQLKNER